MTLQPITVRESSPAAFAVAATLIRQAVLILALTFVSPLAALAAEGGTEHYLPGGTATLIDLAPTKPGWVVEPIYLHYD
jgi:hypothetical protein